AEKTLARVAGSRTVRAMLSTPKPSSRPAPRRTAAAAASSSTRRAAKPAPPAAKSAKAPPPARRKAAAPAVARSPAKAKAKSAGAVAPVASTGPRPLGLPADALATLGRSDAALGRLMARVGSCTMEVGRAENHLASLVRAIIYQQLSGKAAATIYGRFRA